VKLHNTLTHSLEEFVPAEPGHVRMYNCGPTVYGEQHVGNYRTFAFADTLRRAFEFKGWRVTQIMNITDVGHLTQDNIDAGEDKIMVKARELGWTAIQVAEHFMKRFFEDRRELLFLEPARFTRATDYIPEMVALVKTLLEKGHAYVAGKGDVYFDVSTFPGYGRLSGNTVETLKAGARVEVNTDKRHPADFALWKTDEKHLMQWDAPWGRGFPGWHIECSAMSMKHLGETLDIHTGGEDNIFPHHECEIAQSEAATGKPFSRFWLHARHLQWDGEKISKRLGNVVLVKDMIARGYTPHEIRYVLVSTRYSQRVNFSWQSFEDARKAVAGLAEGRRRLAGAARKPGGAGGPDPAKALRDFEARLDDDLDSSGALGVLHTFVREGNRAVDQGLAGEGASARLAAFDRMAAVFGVVPDGREEAAPEEVVRLAKERQEARSRKDFAASDAARDRIKALGWSVEDTQDGPAIRKL
jgi:cysteinyl-tRNA synthetase